MRIVGGLTFAALLTTCVTLMAQEPQPAESHVKDKTWTKSLADRAKRGTLHDGAQYVRGDSGKWSDEPRLLHAPPLAAKPAKMTLDDWFDQLLEQPGAASSAKDDNWLLVRTRQLDDNDRVWVEKVQRRGNQFTVVVSEAIWQGRYFKTFTYYQAFGVNLGKLEPGMYEATVVIKPLAFKQFEGDGRPATFVNNRQINNWSKDEASVDKKPVELRTTFIVAASDSSNNR